MLVFLYIVFFFVSVSLFDVYLIYLFYKIIFFVLISKFITKMCDTEFCLNMLMKLQLYVE